MDNCTRENRKQSLFGYLIPLVLLERFWCYLRFVPSSRLYTWTNWPSVYSTSRRLRANNAVTLTELYQKLSALYKDLSTVTSVASVANISGILENPIAFNVPQLHSHTFVNFIFLGRKMVLWTARFNIMSILSGHGLRWHKWLFLHMLQIPPKRQGMSFTMKTENYTEWNELVLKRQESIVWWKWESC